MSVERTIAAFWVVQGILALLILLRDARRHDWLRVKGVAAGLAVGFTPLVATSFNIAVLATPMVVIIGAAPIMLIMSYGLARRWVAFALTLLLLGGPLAYVLVHARLFPAARDPFLEWVLPLVEIQFFLTPILCALAGRELFALIGNRYSKERTA